MPGIEHVMRNARLNINKRRYSSKGKKSNTCLFLCTGNYYRSRMAEEVFNSIARDRNINAESDSAGLHPDVLSLGHVGNMARESIRELERGGYEAASSDREPKTIVDKDLGDYDTIICLDKTEHEDIFWKTFPGFEGDVRFWTVEDYPLDIPRNAFLKIEKEVKELIEEAA